MLDMREILFRSRDKQQQAANKIGVCTATIRKWCDGSPIAARYQPRIRAAYAEILKKYPHLDK